MKTAEQTWNEATKQQRTILLDKALPGAISWLDFDDVAHISWNAISLAHQLAIADVLTLQYYTEVLKGVHGQEAEKAARVSYCIALAKGIKQQRGHQVAKIIRTAGDAFVTALASTGHISGETHAQRERRLNFTASIRDEFEGYLADMNHWDNQ